MFAPIAIKDIQFFVRNVRTRMPFRYGTATVRAAPMLRVSMEVELTTGSRATGYAADVLPPKWFDKDPDKSYEENIQDLVWGAQTAASIYQDIASTPGVAFDIWRLAYSAMLQRADEHGVNHLTGGHGSSLMERALIDALGRGIGASYFELLKDNLLGLDLGAMLERVWIDESGPRPVAEAAMPGPTVAREPVSLS